MNDEVIEWKGLIRMQFVRPNRPPRPQGSTMGPWYDEMEYPPDGPACEGSSSASNEQFASFFAQLSFRKWDSKRGQMCSAMYDGTLTGEPFVGC